MTDVMQGSEHRIDSEDGWQDNDLWRQRTCCGSDAGKQSVQPITIQPIFSSKCILMYAVATNCPHSYCFGCIRKHKGVQVHICWH